MAAKEAKARIKINKLLEESGWRFFDDVSGKANIVLEPKVKLTKTVIDALGEDFERASIGFVDFVLLDEAGFPLVVLEAKSEDKNPLVGKEQARKYAKSQNCRFVILSNGNLHYFWDLEQGSPHIVTRFPTPDSIKGYLRFRPNPQRLITEPVSKDYIVLTQMPNYAAEVGWNNSAERESFIEKNRLRFLREYQKFLLDQSPDELANHADAIVVLKYFFKAYATDGRLRDIVEKRRLADLHVYPAFSMADFKAVPKEWRERISEYVKDYVSLNQFMQ